MTDELSTLKARLDAAEKEHAAANAELSRASGRGAKARKDCQKAQHAYIEAIQRSNEPRTRAG